MTFNGKFSQFKTAVKSIVRSALTMRDNIDAAARVALVQYAEHGDTTWLSFLLTETVNVKSLATGTLSNWICAHANVKRAKSKSGDIVFRKVSRNADIVVTMPEPDDHWYDFDTTGQAKPDVDAYVALRALIRKIQSSWEDGRAKDQGASEMLLKRLDGLATLNS